jgi:hypothetical protein
MEPPLQMVTIGAAGTPTALTVEVTVRAAGVQPPLQWIATVRVAT